MLFFVEATVLPEISPMILLELTLTRSEVYIYILFYASVFDKRKVTRVVHHQNKI
jgi:hypothetical protein